MAATEAAFRGGDASFLELVDAERLLLEFELARERAFAEYGMEMARIEQLTALDTSSNEEGKP